MKLITAIFFILFSSTALCCSFRNAPHPDFSNPTFVGKVSKIENRSSLTAIATIIVLTSNDEHYIVGKEYNFVVRGKNATGSCNARVKEGASYKIVFSYIPESKRTKGLEKFEGHLFAIATQEITEESPAPVNQALKAQPSAAGTPQSGAP